MRILMVNVNTTESMTASIAAQARRAAAAGTEIVPLTPRFGPSRWRGTSRAIWRRSPSWTG